MATLTAVLAQVRQNESSGDYSAQNPTSSASGAYQFINSTWQNLTQQSGIGTQYATAKEAPANVQDAVAAYALTQNPNANSSSLWQASSQGGAYPIVTDYNVTPAQLLAGGVGGSFGSGDTSNQGFGSNGSDVNTITVTPSGSGGSGSGLGSDLSTLAEVGYTPPASTGGPSTVGLAPGVAAQINTIAQNATNTFTTAATNATNTFTSAVGAGLSGVENWVARAGLIVVAVIILLVALWRVLDPSGEQTKAAFKHVGEAVAA